MNPEVNNCLYPKVAKSANYISIVYLVVVLILQPLLSFAIVYPAIDHLSINNGLSNNEVRCIYQDDQGFVWFGTYDGLNRYDGYNFKIFRNNPNNSKSIINNWINCITQDTRHDLWVGTRQGINIFNRVSEKFTPVYAFFPGNSQPKKLSTYIKDIKTDATGLVYVASQDNGLIVFDRKHQETGYGVPLIDGHKIIVNYNVTSLCTDGLQHVYLMVKDHGLCLYNKEKKQAEVINKSITAASCMQADKGRLWIGTSSGLHRYDIKLGYYNLELSEGPEKLSSNRITSIQPMRDSSLWIGTDGGGINILNINTGKFNYLNSNLSQFSLSSNAVYAIYVDKQNRKWIGTLRGGVNIIDDYKSRFLNIAHNPINANSLINNFVKSIFETSDKKIWIGTDGGGLSIWDRRENTFENYSHSPGDSRQINSNFITCIQQDSFGKIWIATYSNGINQYLPQSKEFKVYKGVNEAGNPVTSIFWILKEDRAHNLWASALQDGFYRYDRQNDRFSVFDSKLINILAITEDHYGKLWGGSFDGIYEIDRINKKHKFFPVGKSVRSIHEDKWGNMWLGTEAGLMLFDRNKHRIVRKYTTDDGLSNNTILAIEEDSFGHLWMSTYNGISRFDPQKRIFTNYFESDGLLNREFNYNASLHLSTGELAFGGINGLSLFRPEQIVPIKDNSNLVITGIKINNHPSSDYLFGLKSDSKKLITSLTVPYDEASLSFDFAAINFTAQERISYRYTMEGWDRGWNYSGHNRTAVYTRLSPGTYTFKINATNSEGQWLSKQAYLKVIVLPPWYRTWWAYLVYVLLVISFIYWYLDYKFRETRLKYEIKLAVANAENQKTLQEKERELHERRLEFFTGMSHEFRTPLSLIINPIKDLLDRSLENDRQDLNIIYRNARRLLSLVDQLLLFRKADDGISQLNIGPINIFEVCRDVKSCFIPQAKTGHLHYELIADVKDLVIYGDREKIEIILFNLISNAIKYTPQNGKVIISIKEDTEFVNISVADTGQGIPEDVKERLFDKFYRSKDTTGLLKAGFGIGLYLARQFTAEHHGSLSYISEVSTGTVFLLQLKKGTAHFAGKEIAATGSQSSELLNELADSLPVANIVENQLDFKGQGIITDKKVILIIDDDHELRRYIKSILEKSYLICEAADGLSGIAVAKEKLPDLIICDVMMPGLNGIELCAIIKQDPLLNYIPMILLTASSSAENKIKGLESGADDYINKPFEKEILIARVANLLQMRSNLQSYFYNAVTLKKSNINISEEYKHFLEKCIEVVEKHLTDEHFNVHVLANEIGMSRSNLFRKVKFLSGHSINSFIRYIRLRKAAELLIQSNMNVNEVALETGFNNIKYFRTQFFKLFGVNPSDFVRQKRPVFKKRFNVSGT